MKKRILSMLLLVAMIVTAVPVMSTAAGAETSSTATEYGDYKDLYVKDGLVNMYTAYVGDASVDLSTGTWASALEGGTAATLGNKQYWVKGTYGGVGNTQIWGSYIDGVFSADSKYNNNDVVNTRLEFGIAQLPARDYTIEYVADYGYIMSVDAEGNPVKELTNIDGATWPINTSSMAAWESEGTAGDGRATGNVALDAIGHLRAITQQRDGYFSSASTVPDYGPKGAPVFIYNAAQNPNPWSWGDVAPFLTVYNQNQSFYKRDDGIVTYQIYRTVVEEVVTEDVEGVATEVTKYHSTIGVAWDGTLYREQTKTVDLTKEKTQGYFYLAERLSVAFFAARIYDRKLTAEEMAQNKMADVLGYYDIKFLDNDAVVGGLKTSAGTFASYTLATDASEYAATKNAVQAIVDGVMAAELPYQLYVKDGLTALYGAYGEKDTTVTLVESGSGTWANRVYGGKAASLGNGNRWDLGTTLGGGLGFSTFAGQIDAEGNYTLTSSYNTYNDSYTFLNFGIEMLPTEDYSIQFVGSYRPVYVANAEDGSVAIDEETGKPIAAIDMGANLEGALDARTDKAAADALGFFNSIVASADGVGTWSIPRGGVIWVAAATGWGDATHNTWWIGGNGCTYNKNGGLCWNYDTSDTFHVHEKIVTYMYTLDETTTTTDAVIDAETGEETTPATTTTTALFKLWRDGKVWHSNAANVNSTAKAAGGTHYIDNYGSAFYLNAGIPITYYSVRIYDKLLSDVEMKQNHAADIALYYGLTLSMDHISDEAAKSKLIIALFDESFIEDESAYSAKKLELQTEIDAIKPADLDGLADMYVQDGLAALYTAFAGDAYVDLENGTWTDRVSGATATLGNKQYWANRANGGVGVTQLWGSYVDGVYATTENDTFNVLGTRLDFGIDQLPFRDYTVEYLADYNYVMTADAEGNFTQIAVNLPMYNEETAPTGMVWPNNAALSNQTVANCAIDQLGNLQSFSNSGRDKAFAVGAEGYYGGAGSVAWKFNSNRPENGWNSGNGSEALFVASNVFHSRATGVNTYEIGRTVSVADDVTTSTLSLYRDGAFYKSTTSQLSIANEHVGGDDFFYLGERLSVDYYAVRIYARALTDAERAQNRFVDILLYYGLEITEEILKDENKMAEINTAISAAPFAVDSAEYAAKKAELQNIITPVVEFDGIEDLYVKDGLKALFTAFAGDEAYFSDSKWIDRISGKALGSFVNQGETNLWKMGANGGIGFNVYAGEIDDNGTVTGVGAYDTITKSYRRLDFDVALLPTVDYTVEYIAMYRPVYVADKEASAAAGVGVPALGEDGLPLASWQYEAIATAGNTYTSREDKIGLDVLGNFVSFQHRTTIDDAWSGGRNATRWQHGVGTNWTNTEWIGSSWDATGALNRGANDPFQLEGEVVLYSLVRDETASDTGISATFSLYQNNALYNSCAFAVGSYKDGEEDFWLSAGRPTDFYALRIYNRTLTAAENRQNHFVDIVLYYGLTIDEYILEDEALLADLKAMFASETFVADEAEYAAKKVALQKIIDNDIDLGGNANLYVTKGLVAMFTAFAGDEAYVDTVNGTWTDRVSGTTAYLVNQGETQLWTMSAKGGVGFNVYAGEIDDAGNVTGVGAYDTITKSYRRLDFDVALLPTDDYTVEYLAMYRPVYVADKEASAAAGYGVPATDASGNPLASWQYEAIATAGNTYNSREDKVGLDVLGNFVSFQHRTTIDDAWSGGRNATRWQHGVGTNLTNTSWIGSSWGATGALNRGANDPFQLEGEVVLYSLVRDETASDTGISATFSLYQNNALYNSCAFAVGSYKNGEADFWLSAGRPTDFYTVRIYKRVLTAAENQQNHLADVVLYYGASIPENMLPGGDKYEQLATAIGGIGFVTDEVERAAMSLKIKATIRDLEKNSDLLSLYVQDNLVGLFTALNSLDSTAVANGTWANRIYGGASAQFVGGRWVKNVNGSVGTTQIYGMYNTETETWTAESEYNTVVADGNGVSTRLLFDASLLNAMNDDYTLEYVAQYRPLMSVDANGTPVAETYVVGTVPTSGGWGCNYGVASPVDQVGFLRAFTTGRDANNQDFGRNVFSFSVNPRYDGGAYGWGTEGKTLFNFGFYSNDQVVSYAVIKDENDAHTAATYSMVRNGAAAKTIEFEEGKYDFTTPEANASSAFYLADYMSVDFFAVRIYSDVLTTYEMAQNKAIDTVYYYALTLPEEVYTNANALAALVATLSDAKIVTDTAERAALKAEYQARLNNLEAKEEVETIVNYNDLYVQDGLVGLYTAFAGDDAVNVMGGTWANAIDNEYGAATLRGVSFWKRGTVGVGYTIESVEAYSENAYKIGIDLPETFADLENFTVEAFATAKGITNPDGSRYSQTDAVYYPAVKSETYVSGFRFGMLNALFFAAMNPGNADETRFAARWFVTNWSYIGYDATDPTIPGGNADRGTIIARNYTDSAGVEIYDNSDQGFRNMGPMYNPTAGVMQVSKVTDEIGDVTYEIHYDNKKAADDKSITITAEKYELYMQTARNGGKEGYFSLFTALPADVYAIRVYNRTLTDAEKLQNSFVDKAGFYQIDLSDFASVENKTEIYEYFAEIGTDLTNEAAQALYDMKVNGGTEVVGNSVLKFQKYLPILNGAYGYRVLFEVSEDSVAMIEDAFEGYSVHYGAIVAPASSNATSDLVVSGVTANAITTSATNGQVVVVGGELGSNLFYNYTDIGTGKVAFSVAVTASDAALFGADMIVRAFVTVTDADGAIVGTYYDEAVENEMLDGTVSIATAADYFVNEFEGDAATEYKYMNAATLRDVLKASGRDVTRVVANDLTLYVDPANGSDGNDGESLENAFATLDKAYEVTKAHLALTGLRNVTIYLAEGTHYISETFALNADEINADAHSVKIVGMGGATVSSAQPLDIDPSGAENYDGSVYYVQLPKVNGKYPLIRDLAAKDGYDESFDFAMSTLGSREETVTIQKVEFTDGETVYDGDQDLDWTLSEDLAATTTEAILYVNASDLASDVVGAEIHFTLQWCFNIMHVKSVEYAGGYAKLHIAYDEFKSTAGLSTDRNLAGDVAWFKNGKDFLGNGAHEFAYDHATGTLYFDVADGYVEDIVEMRASTLDKLFALNGVTNFSIENVTMTGYADRSYEVGAGQGFGQSGAQNESFHMAAGIYAENVDGLTVKNVTFTNADAAGIAVQPSAKNVIIDSNRFENLGSSAIIFTGTGMSMGNFVKNVTITNNYINAIGNTINSASAIVIKTAANTLIAHNTITNVPYTGISVGWNWDPHGFAEEQVRTGIYRLYNVEIAYNYIANYVLASHDGGAIYTIGGALTTAEAKQVNFVHHNYVNITAATGEHKGSRYFSAYYHDGGSSNWYNYSNVLMNSKNNDGVIDGLFGGYFVQYNPGNDGYNNQFKGNYAIGFKSNAAVFNDVASDVRFSAERGNYAEAYAYASVAALNANTTIVEAGEGDRNCHLIANPNANAAAYVYSIYAAAGSSLDASTKTSGGLTVTAAAIADEIRLTEELTNASDSNTVLVTFNDGTSSFTVPYAIGDTLRVPAEFTKAGFSYVFTIGGETVADLTTVEVTGAITVNVAVTASIQDVVVTDGVTTQVYEVSAGDKIPAEALSGFAKEGYSVIYTIDGELVDLDTFTVGAEGVEIWAQYVKNSYTVTFTDGEEEVVKTVPYGDKVTVPASYARKGHATKAHYGELDVTNGYNVPAENITINVSYVAKDYDVIFIDEDGETELSRVTVTYGTEIPMPETPANKIKGGFVYKFAGWINFEKGMILEEEGLTVTANIYDAFMLVTFVDGNGDVFGTIELPEDGGVIEAAPEGTPVKDEDETYTYTFTGWAGFEAGMPVEEPTTFVAEFEAVKKVVKYTITFTVDGAEYHSYEIEEGALITLPETDPTKDGYVFAGWTDYTEGMTATGNHTFAASFEEEVQAVRGDLNANGVVDGGDISILVDILEGRMDGNGYAYDLNANGVADGGDISILVDILEGRA